MFMGYNTNGFSYHRLDDAIEILASLGYRGIGLTLDVHHLDPYAYPMDRKSWPPPEFIRIRDLMAKHKLICVIETGSRFLLDKRRKHKPTLICPTAEERAIRFEFLARCISMAAYLNAEFVSFWSGAGTEPKAMDLLVSQCRKLAEHAFKCDVNLAFEPEPGMFIDTMEKFAELHRRVDHPMFGLTLDIGHLVCMNEPIRSTILGWKDCLWNVHLDDMKSGVHDHLMFGEGTVDFAEAFAALREIAYQYGAYVELSRHAHDAVQTAARSMAFLRTQ